MGPFETRARRAGGAVKRAVRSIRAPRVNAGASGDGFRINLEYAHRSIPRYGYGKPPHAQLSGILGRNREAYRRLLEQFLAYKEDVLRIPLVEEDAASPYWHNVYFSGLDAVALYSIMSLTNPARFLEIGSGNSTKFARRAIEDQGLRTRITSIDPEPRAEVDALCDDVVRTRLEYTDLGVFDQLDSGDIVFFDGSHRSFPNSDVTVAFLEVLPRLKPGVLVEFHDITLPWDYPQFFCDQYYSEQYLLASYLLAGGDSFEVVLPDFFVTISPDLHHILDPIWDRFVWSNTAMNGLSFWLRKNGASEPVIP